MLLFIKSPLSRVILVMCNYLLRTLQNTGFKTELNVEIVYAINLWPRENLEKITGWVPLRLQINLMTKFKERRWFGSASFDRPRYSYFIVS